MEERVSILIVDDSRMNRHILSDIFQEDYEILEAEDGRRAIDMLGIHQKIAVMILDIHMPRMNGFDVLDYIRRLPPHARVPVVVNTQYGEENNEIKAFRLGAKDFITKPYQAEIVRQRVKNVLAGYLMEKDRLTGIYTRDSFCRRTQELLNKNQKTEYMIICCDFEHFQMVNDRFGTEMGDQILQDLARWLESSIHNRGTYGRMEGDKFAVCIPKNGTDIEQMIQEADSIFRKRLLNYQLFFYFGIYLAQDKELPVHQMCDRAFMALRTVKGNYLKRYAYYDDVLRDKMLKEQAILDEMQIALDRGDFCPYMQPIYDIMTGEMVSAEALVRWVHPKEGLLCPADFIPIFEHNGFISKVDVYIWESVCKFQDWCRSHGYEILPISVNVSRIDFYNLDLAAIFTDLVAKYNLSPSYLKIEITESQYMDNPGKLIETMKTLQKKGFKILIDDFGSGYSSLNMLKDVPADILKIDMKFIENLQESTRAESIVRYVVEMARELEMDTVVEGVEDEAQLTFLKKIHCNKVQGYYFSRPVSIPDYVKLLWKK